MGIKGWVESILQSWLADWLADQLKPLVIIVGMSVMGWLKTKTWPWVGPVIWALLTGVILYGFFYGFPSSSSTPEVAPLRPGLTYNERNRIEGDFRSLPRPCLLRITAPREHMLFRQELANAAIASGHPGIRQGQMVIEACTIVRDEKDENPDLYPDQLTYAPQGIVIVNGAPAKREIVTFLVEKLRGRLGWNVRPGDTLLPESPENLIYIQIGPGDLKRR